MATTLASIETQARRYLVEPSALSTPSAPTVTPQGTTGATSYSYKIVALNATGTTDASSAGSTSTGNATLTGSNFNRITWTAVTDATGYWVYRTASGGTPSSTGRIASLGAVTTLDDTALAGDSTTAPTTNTTGLDKPFWSSAELIDIIIKGAKDLWGAILDLNEEHFLTIDTTNVTLAASATQLSGVPTDTFRVYLIEPSDTTDTGTGRNLSFMARDYNSMEFVNARTMPALDPTSGGVIYYAVSSAGFPVAAPVVLTAPKISAALALRFVYIPGLGTLTSASDNPIPGESDEALIAWCVAHARSKERDDRSPDPGWIAVYGTEKQNVLNRLAPRQVQEPLIIPAMFQELW